MPAPIDPKLVEEAYRRFPDDVRPYTEKEVRELARLGIAAHPEGAIEVDRGGLRAAFVSGAQFARELENDDEG